MAPLVARYFGDVVYNSVGQTIGYVIAPLSLAGLGMPATLLMSRGVQVWLGGIFIAVAMLGFAGNVYFSLRRMAVARSASAFPLIVSMAGIPAVVVLEGELTLRALLAGLGILLLDLLGPAMVAVLIGRRLVTEPRSSDDRPT
jgi:hypothetical protein